MYFFFEIHSLISSFRLFVLRKESSVMLCKVFLKKLLPERLENFLETEGMTLQSSVTRNYLCS